MDKRKQVSMDEQQIKKFIKELEATDSPMYITVKESKPIDRNGLIALAMTGVFVLGLVALAIWAFK